MMFKHRHGIYLDGCIVCGGPIGDDRLLEGLPCRRCLPNPEELSLEDNRGRLEAIYRLILKNRRTKDIESSRLKEFKKYVLVEEKTEEFKEIFKKAVGNNPWSVQLTWAKRVFLNDSFSIVAPTGIGKTVFGIIMSIYKTYYEDKEGTNKAYIVVPTTPLVKQVHQKAIEFLENLGLDPGLTIAYHSDMSRKERREIINKIVEGDFKILITTNQFISKRFDILSRHTFEFIQVDDVDAVLRSSKNIENIIILLMKKKVWKDNRDNTNSLRRYIKKILDLLVEIRRAAREGDYNRIQDLRKEIMVEKDKLKAMGVLVISSATGRPRGIRVKLFKEILNFEVGLRSETIRNIVDTYLLTKDLEDSEKSLIRMVKKLGRGGLIYVPVDLGVGYAEKLVEKLRQNGVKAGLLVSGKLDALDQFLTGDIDVLVGIAIYYGVMVRGLDYPESIRYAVFIGTPRFKFNARFTEPTITQVSKTLSIIKDVVDDDEKRRVERWLRIANGVLKRGTVYYLKRINEVLRGEADPETRTEERLLEALNYIKTKISDPDIRSRILDHPEVFVKTEDNEMYLYIPDIYTYIQASGRTSRMYAGGITRGLSIIMEYEEKLLKILRRRLSLIFDELEWIDFRNLDLERVRREIDDDRERVRAVREGRLTTEYRDPIKPVLIIVESPNKARTIARFFGKPSIRRRNGFTVYEVSTGDILLSISATGGHIYDLVERLDRLPENILEEISRYGESVKELHSILVVDDGEHYIPVYGPIKICGKGHQFILPKKIEIDGKEYQVCPKCYRDFQRRWNRRRKNKDEEAEKRFFEGLTKIDIRNKGEVVRFLRRLALETGNVLIGTDPDTEGEKIGWDIASMVKPFTKSLERIEFHEVTRKAISKSINSGRELNENLVEAQIVRRIEDRWIGFELTRKIFQTLRSENVRDWAKETVLGGWSAGRVQTPVLGWIVNRRQEVEESKRRGILIYIPREGEKRHVLKREAGGWLDETLPPPSGKARIRLEVIERLVREASPPPSLTTDTLLREANKRFRLDSKTVMKLAQDLFESGLITYHRTDSIRISDEGIGIARKYLSTVYGEEGVKALYPRRWGEGGAHEAIRPTKPIDPDMLRDMVREGDISTSIDLSENHYRIYDLIFHRFILSQLRPARVEEARVRLYIGGRMIEELTVPVKIRGEIEARFYSHLLELIPEWSEDRVLNATYEYRDIYLVNDYTEGEIIELMRKRQIGRPSTYSTVISTLKQRRYVRTIYRVYLIPTQKGKKVYNHITKYYKDLVSEDRTKLILRYMDEIEKGEKNYVEVLKTLYREIMSIHERERDLSQARTARTAGPRLSQTGPF